MLVQDYQIQLSHYHHQLQVGNFLNKLEIIIFHTYIIPIILLIFRANFPTTCLGILLARMALLDLRRRKWRKFWVLRRTLPVPVILNRAATPFLVFCLYLVIYLLISLIRRITQIQ